jgi:hypothetical protein
MQQKKQQQIVQLTLRPKRDHERMSKMKANMYGVYSQKFTLVGSSEVQVL